MFPQLKSAFDGVAFDTLLRPEHVFHLNTKNAWGTRLVTELLKRGKEVDVLAEIRAAVEGLPSDGKIPAYFAALQEWLEPLRGVMERNHKHVTTPKGNADYLHVARDLSR
jgi:hypothetical protein